MEFKKIIMKPRYSIFCCFFMLIALQGFCQSPLEFVQNRGQWGKWFEYKTDTRGADICLEQDGFRYIMHDKSNNTNLDKYHHGAIKDIPVLKFHCYKMTFEGAKKPQIQGSRPFDVYYNYFLGNDSAKWKTGIHPCRNVGYTNLYNGIDMSVASEKGNMIYDFIVKPNADVNEIKLLFEGQDGLSVSNNMLTIHTSVGDATESKPYAYQLINDERKEVTCNYKLNENRITFEFPNGYDHSQTLYIDPTVDFCTLTGSKADNWGFTATYDDAGNFYNGGLVNCLNFGGTFPVSPGAFQTTFGGGFTGSALYGPYATDSVYASDISIIKYDPTGVSRIYATYLGGSGNERPHSMIVDPSNELIVVGRTRSTDYPVTPGAYHTANAGGTDMVLTKFNASGTALIGSTYMGGTGDDGVNYDSTEIIFGQLKFNYGDDARSEVQVDKLGNIYMTGSTSSTDFPVTAGTALATTLSGMQDGVVFKMNSTLTNLIWSTYIGGSGSDAGYVLAFDTSQASLFVAGGTNSANFPVTPGTLHTTYQGGPADGFVLKFKNSAPYSLQAGTYVGTSHYDQIYGVQVSGDDHVYVMGQSLGGTFPVTVPAASVFTPNSCQFVMKMDNLLTTDLVSTVFGNGHPDSTNISPVAFLVDTCENVYISGWGGDLGLSSQYLATGTATGMPTTTDAIRLTSPLGRDFYFIVLGSGMTTLRYATYYGRSCDSLGQQWEGCHVDGGTSRFSRQGIIYQAMCANCGGVYSYPANRGGCYEMFPTTSGVWSMIDSSANCNEAALKIAFNIGPVTVDIVAGPSTTGCAPLTVNFTNLSTNVLTYVWNFGDGTTTSTVFSPTHTFTAAGVYTVTLNAANSNACFRVADSMKLVISVGTNVITPGFTFVYNDSCGPYTATFTNTSADTVGTPAYQWWFGDGSTFTGANPPLHTYPDTGTYVVTMVMTDAAACKSPDTIIHIVHFLKESASASYTIPDSICLGAAFSPIVKMSNVNTITWAFGDGQSSTQTDPSHLYNSVGSYTVTLTALNSTGCGGGDTISETIKVLPVPTANFSLVPITAEANIPTTFTNLSVNATRYLWDFGDNTTSTEVNPIHQYQKTGVYKACLTAYNRSNCPSIACKEAPADIEPLLGLPTAFSPNGDGENDVLYVRGAAIANLDLKIFNRWGQLVFETTSQQKGWDGTFNGQPQPIDAYAYVLNCSFIDGTAKMLKGNITLLR